MPEQSNRAQEEAFHNKRKAKAKAKRIQDQVVKNRVALREHNTKSAKAKRKRDAITKKIVPSGFTRLMDTLTGSGK